MNRRYLAVLIAIFVFISQGIQAQNKKQPSLRVMTYNIRTSTAKKDSINSWELRKGKVSAFINYHHPDILGIQEATLIQMKDLENGLSDFAWYGVGKLQESILCHKGDKGRNTESTKFTSVLSAITLVFSGV